MQYSNTTAKQLEALGFEFSYRNSPEDDAALDYEVWLKGKLDVMIDHAYKKVVLNIEEACCDTEEFTSSDLEVLNRLFNS